MKPAAVSRPSPYTRRRIHAEAVLQICRALSGSVAADVARLTRGCGWGRELSQVEGRG